MTIENALAYIDESADRRLAELIDLLRIPSVSTLPERREDVRRAAAFVAEALRRAGLEAVETIETTAREAGGHPVVYGEWLEAGKGAPTVLVYGHYDVQPPDPLDLWKPTGPFEPAIRDGNLYARGSTDDKGQMYCHVKAIEAWLRGPARRLPVNVKVLIEGEEEIGSPHLRPFIEKWRERLRCDVVVVSDTSQFADGVPAITYGLRGLVYMQLKVLGPKVDLHSGCFGGSLTNPGNALCQIVASLRDPQTGRVLVDGFYDRVRPLESWERDQFAALPFDEDGYRRQLGVASLAGELDYTTNERRWARPTLDVNGLFGGFQGPGAKTIIPSWCGAKVSMRLVPDQRADEIAAAFERTVRRLAPPGVTVEVSGGGSDPVLVPTDTPYMRAARRAVEQGFGRSPVLIREGGSIPVALAFKELLRADTLLVGFGLPDDGAHSPNEKLKVEDFHRGVKTAAMLLWELARAEGGA